MLESNYEILGIHENATKKEIQEAFRRLALEHHSDRGGEVEKFMKIKQAYEDLKIGKKYADSDSEKQRKSKVYSSDDEEDIRRRNKILAKEVSREMKIAQEWAAALNRSNATGVRLFGSKTLGEIEIERKANGVLSIKGNVMAGKLSYDGPIIMTGNITSPSFSEENVTTIKITKGDFKMINPLEHKYKIDNGAKILVEDGDIVVGNVFGKKDKVQDPLGKVGVYTIKEHRTELLAPKGKIVLENVADTVKIEADTIIVLNLEDDVILKGREILIYGHKVTYDVKIELTKGGTLRFFEDFSIQGLSDDAKVKLENGKEIRLHELKTKKIRDLSEEFVKNEGEYGKDQTMVGKGFPITYEILDNFYKKPVKSKSKNWTSKIGKFRFSQKNN